jgi:ubiquinone/menaquinone biosynthesis C-methylase UbiE
MVDALSVLFGAIPWSEAAYLRLIPQPARLRAMAGEVAIEAVASRMRKTPPMTPTVSEATRQETERVVRVQNKQAPAYDRQMNFFDRVLFGGGREWVCSRAEGRVLEIAVGTGRNLDHHRSDVQLTGIELSPEMLAIGRGRAEQLGRAVDLRVGDAQALEFADASFDTVVCTLGLCTIPDPRRAVAEARRVLRPGGRLLLLEHVRSPVRAVRVIERLLEPLSVRFAADHLTREPLDYLRAEGFEIERLERSKWGIVERVSARKPSGLS